MNGAREFSSRTESRGQLTSESRQSRHCRSATDQTLPAQPSTPLPLPYSQVPPLTFRFLHWLRDRPMSQRDARARIPAWAVRSRSRVSRAFESGGCGGGSRALRVPEAEGTAGLTRAETMFRAAAPGQLRRAVSPGRKGRAGDLRAAAC